MGTSILYILSIIFLISGFMIYKKSDKKGITAYLSPKDCSKYTIMRKKSVWKIDIAIL